jgi:sialate O-acetylesterase
MSRRIIALCSLVNLFLSATGYAELHFAPIFNNGAVLQSEMPVNVWGTADPKSIVTVSFAGQEKKAVADDSGKWLVKLDPMSMSSEPRTLTCVSSIENQKSEIKNVVVGEVWLATGQSNMVIPLRATDGGEERLAKNLPEIRFVKVPEQTGLPVENKFTAADLTWNTFKPPVNQQIAAVAFYFAEHLQKNIGGIVGIIQDSYGGTPCEAWTPEWALEANPKLKYMADQIRKGLASGKTKEQWKKEDADFWAFWRARREWSQTKIGPPPAAVPQPGPENPWSKNAPTGLYENMIRPIIPYTARGIVWYQGESNASKPDEYRVLFPTMIEAWRKVWDRPDWPFFFVQLAAFDHQSPAADWAGLRAAQAFTRDTVPNTGMALALDHGEKENIHPAAKQPVGERLALLALADVYGQNVVSRGPDFNSMKVEGNRVFIQFGHTADGLKTRDGKATVPGFEVAGANGKFCSAQAHIIGKDTIELTCAEVSHPVSVRYAWHNWIEPPVTLENSAGLPAEPFVAP